MSTRDLQQQSSPPKFGREMLQYFALDPTYTNLNHGSFGALPRHVARACEDISMEIESCPDYFIRMAFQARIDAVRERLAECIGADTRDCVLVANVSAGVNTVLRNFDWEDGDIIVLFNTSFESIREAAADLMSSHRRLCVSEITLNFPLKRNEILFQFREHLESLPRNPQGKVVAIIDSITCSPAAKMPWMDMIQICKEERVYSVIDAAHSLGQELDIDLSKADPDFWIGSTSKWLFGKRGGSGLLYVAERNQHLVTKTILPAVIYPSLTGSGTIDFVPPLSVIAALAFRDWLGGEKVINTYCHQLAITGGKRLAEVMETSMMYNDESDGAETHIPNMVNVRLPISAKVTPSAKVFAALQAEMLVKHKVFASPFYHNGIWWTRASAQIYNELQDFERLGRAYLILCKEVNSLAAD